MAESSAPRKPYPSDLTDDQWALIEPLIPPQKPGGRPRETDMREVLNTLLYMSRTGCQWRYLPHDLLPKSTVWEYFNAWGQDGTWQAVMDALRRRARKEAGREEDPSAAVIDTQTVPTHHQGADSAVDGGKRVKGRERHAVVDTMGFLLAVAVTAANAHDGRAAPQVLEKLTPQTKRRLAVAVGDDKYNTQPLRDWLRERGERYSVEVVSRPPGLFRVVPFRWVVERTYGWLGYNRRLSKDYERTTSSGEAWVQLGMIHLLVKRLKPSGRDPEFRYRRRA